MIDISYLWTTITRIYDRYIYQIYLWLIGFINFKLGGTPPCNGARSPAPRPPWLHRDAVLNSVVRTWRCSCLNMSNPVDIRVSKQCSNAQHQRHKLDIYSIYTQYHVCYNDHVWSRETVSWQKVLSISLNQEPFAKSTSPRNGRER